MSAEYKVVLGQIREAYARVQSGGLRPSAWKREGASSYTVDRVKSKTTTGGSLAKQAPAKVGAKK